MPLTATGFFAQVHAGEQFELIGSWSNHPTYGLQFKIDRMVPLRPTTKEAILRYLASGMIKGIGPKTASRIVDHFGEATLDVIDQDARRLHEVPAISRKKAEQIIDSWAGQRAVAQVMMFLNTHGISPLFAARIFREYGPEAVQILSRDPYRLASDIHGIGFISADQVARSMGIAADSVERLRAATIYSLQQAEDKGHCYVTTPQLLTILSGIMQLPEERVLPRLAKVLGQLNDTGAIVSEKISLNSGEQTSAHYRQDLLVAELDIAQHIAKLLKVPLATELARIQAWLDKYAEASGTTLSDQQIDAVRKAASNRIFILTGGPGVGKTTTANTIIRLLKAMGKTVALGAPTGRAAQRLTEVAAAPARTIHRMLEWVPHMHTFARDETNPLTVQAVIIDEASMLDVRLASALIRAVPPNAQLILIGDVDQLPSVGPGNVLRDLIDSGQVPFTRLTEIFRQAATSQIVRSAHAINAGSAVQFDEGPTDCQFIEVESGEELRRVIQDLVEKRIPREYGFDPITDVQVLTPMNRGELGTVALNEELQRRLNPLATGATEFRRGQLTLRPGDKVIQSANNYDLGVFNGDIGFVRDTRVEGGKLLVSFGDDRLVTYEDDAILDLRLAYAITIHKSQGSEFPVVIIPSSMQHYVMLQRNLVYTALTRARKLAFFVGAKKALAFATQNQASLARQTGLISRLKRTTEERA